MEGEIDSKYEFNAPKFIDFLQGDVDQDADKWFEERAGDEGGIDLDMVEIYEKTMSTGGFENATSAISAALMDNLKEQQQAGSSSCKPTNERKEEEREEKIAQQDNPMDVSMQNELKNNVFEEEQGEKDVHNSTFTKDDDNEQNNCENTNNKVENNFTTDDNSENKGNENEANQVNCESVGNESNSDSNKPTAAAEKQTRRSVRQSNIRTSWNSPANKVKKTVTPRRSQPVRSTSTKKIDYSDTKKRKQSFVNPEVVNKKKKLEAKPLVIPQTPSFVRKLRERGARKSVQSTETMAMKKMQELRRQTKEQMKRNERKVKNVLSVGSYLPTRSICPVTRPKEFHFATDTRVKDHTMQTRGDSSKPFQSQLRQHPPSPVNKKPGGVTKAKPFNLSKPAASGPVKGNWESMAHLAMKFQTKTPERFRAKRKEVKNGSLNEKTAPQITHPKTPNLTTKTRSRPVNVPSRKEIEEKEAEEVSNYTFKATELNPKIFEKGGMYGVKQIPEAHTTKIKPFNFQIENRIEQRHQKDEKTKEEEKGHPKANTSSVGKHHRNTEVKPFSFENKDKERIVKKEEKIKEQLKNEEKLHEFQARPLPTFSPDPLPAVAPKHTTNPVPFKISAGSQAYQQKMQEKLKKEEEEAQTQREFRAKPANHRAPFRPATGLVAPTDITDFTLNTDARAKERQKFEEWKHEKEVEQEEERKRVEQENQQQEENEVRRLRKQAVLKAQPVRQYKPTVIEHSHKELTEPQTPNFQTNKRFHKK